MGRKFTEDEVNRFARGDKTKRLDAEASASIRVKVRDLIPLLERLDEAKGTLFPGTNTKIGISGIRKARGASNARILESSVKFRGRESSEATAVMEAILARFLR